MIRYAQLPVKFNAQGAQNSLQHIQSIWQPHFNTTYYEGSWTVFPLRSPGGEGHNIIPDALTTAEYSDTDNMKLFPQVQQLLQSFNCPVMSVRLLNLKAGAVIKPHTDNELCFEKGEARLHFPILTNPDVEFYIDDERITLNTGECWYINANLKHSVANRGTTDRIHLVIDCKVNSWLTALMDSALKISVKEDMDTHQLTMIIAELRLHNTQTSNQLADQMEQQTFQIKS